MNKILSLIALYGIRSKKGLESSFRGNMFSVNSRNSNAHPPLLVAASSRLRHRLVNEAKCV
jgi:hypothetical protein